MAYVEKCYVCDRSTKKGGYVLIIRTTPKTDDAWHRVLCYRCYLTIPKEVRKMIENKVPLPVRRTRSAKSKQRS